MWKGNNFLNWGSLTVCPMLVLVLKCRIGTCLRRMEHLILMGEDALAEEENDVRWIFGDSRILYMVGLRK